MTLSRSTRISLFVVGQIVLVIGLYALFLSPVPWSLSLALVLAGAFLYGLGASSADKRITRLFPLRTRVWLFILSLVLLVLAVFIKWFPAL